MKGIFIKTLKPEITLKSGKVITIDYSYKRGMYYREIPKEYTEEFSDTKSILKNIEKLDGVLWVIQSSLIRKKKYIEKTWFGGKICDLDDIQSMKIVHSVILTNNVTIKKMEKNLPADEFIQYLKDKGIGLGMIGLDLAKGE